MNGSIYDLAAMYTVLVVGSRQTPNGLMDAIGEILDNGYTYEDVRADIIKAFNTHEMFPFYKFKKQNQNGNLLKHGVRYYHKQLNIMSKLKPVYHDIDAGTITSQGDNEYWIEPRASYTIKDLTDYMYSKEMIDRTEFPPNRMYGLMRSFIKQYGLEIVLYMTEYCSRVYESEYRMFSVREFDTYNSIARSYLEEAKNNCVYSGGADYVPRKRMLPD